MKSIIKVGVVALMLLWALRSPVVADPNCCNQLVACNSACGLAMEQCEAYWTGCVPCQTGGGCNGWPPCSCTGCIGGPNNDVCHVALNGCLAGCKGTYQGCCPT